MGSIYKRPRSQYLWIKYYQHGRVVRESSGTTNHVKARRMLRAREGDVEHGIPITPKSGRVTFDEAAADLLNDYTLNKRKSLDHAARRLRLHLAPFFGAKRLASITTADVRAFSVQRTAQGASNAEINRELAILKRMYTLAIQGNKLHTRPHIPLLEERNVRTGFFEREVFAQVRRHLPTEVQPIVTFAYLTGWRIPSEVQTLEWRQVDLETGVVRLNAGTTKNAAGRVLPYGRVLPELADLLSAQRALTTALERASGQIIPWVFHRQGQPIRSFRKAWAEACRLAGCPGRIPHDFRRTAVRNLVRAGVPERVSMQITGHKTASVFARYDIVNEADIRAGLQKLAGTLSGTLNANASKTGGSIG